jgi:hypothetical protein
VPETGFLPVVAMLVIAQNPVSFALAIFENKRKFLLTSLKSVYPHLDAP